MDEISSGSLSPDTTDRASPLESGIGTASPPRSTDRRIVKRLSTTASSSLSSAELLETPPRAPSSPSAASLQLKPEPLSVEMGGKSSSAPLLENNDAEKANGKVPSLQQPRSQSERQLSEIEAQEACKWLRAAGFPQYAQMYEDYQFPIDVSGVAKDHPFLEADSLQSLFRRLHALNRCANMKIDTHHTHSTSHNKSGGGDDSDEDTQCALSENWTFEKKTRRWSRVGEVTQTNVERLQAIAGQNVQSEEDSLEDRLEAEEAEDTMLDTLRYSSLPPGTLPDEISPRFRRTGSERLKDGAKAFLRRVESLKSRRRKQQNRDGIVISSPQILDVMTMQQKMKELNCVDVSPTGPAPVSLNDLVFGSPLHVPGSPVTLPASPYHLPPSPLTNTPSPFGDDSSSYCSDGSQGGGPTPTPTRTKMNRARRFLHRGREDQGALSDSECQPTSWRHRYFRDANSNHAKVLEYVAAHPQSPKDSPTKTPINSRGGSLNLGKESQRYRDKLTGQSQDRYKEDKVAALKREDKMHKSFRHRDDSLREGKPTTKEVTVYREKSRSRSSELAGSQESSSTVASRDSDQEEDSPRHKGTVVRWHSFQRGSLYPEPLDPLCPRAMASMSCGQLLVLRKLALLKLTACMERYCPSHRTGWNWELPKFIRKIKTPDYKDKTVFGVPLLLSLQRTGQALPKCIQIALRWLRANALDQVGIFRKSGVRSRIQKLKMMTETLGDNINFDGQQAFDVADLVKQYFRELPEALLTNKLSETFIAIFQHVPIELRPDAVQCVLLLLPDEHREALETLLDFLNHVASNAPYNQMTASNLAVCLAPSLFHFNHSNANVTNRSSSVSPRRRKTVGIPDQRELSENKAAHDCLLYLVKMHRELFMVSSDMLTQCHFNYMEESIPVVLEELGSEMKQDWRGYLHACTTALLKEAREKSRGWVTVNNPADSTVEMAYKKVGDGHPLRLWRVSTEVEAPPNELLHRVLRERHIWDPQLLKYRLVAKLETNAEVFQYATGNMSPLPARDYCVLRSWRNDLPKGACVIVETSVEHPDAPVMLGGTRGIVLASRYLIEPCGSGKSRIMHLSRVDTKGRTPEWYNKSYGHLAALHLSKIRNSFKHTTDGPESKV
ncbi:stAR-related lipid transfer protein 13 isoform X2 [Ceratina calcarata]|uniref:StAR-related lipid transfer protein 13 isoform X2 n=1 Tax=Ceratina calcarata TaxID=156304 RepID=A0AAJ7S1T7_9HYME|nr:stAR-related lipid transfer protein 13 isoform X2 [Ceratina calcarata]